MHKNRISEIETVSDLMWINTERYEDHFPSNYPSWLDYGNGFTLYGWYDALSHLFMYCPLVNLPFSHESGVVKPTMHPPEWVLVWDYQEDIDITDIDLNDLEDLEP